MNIQYKSTLEVPGTGVISTDVEHGIVEALVSVTGIRDNVNDIIIPGAYEKTIQERKPKGVVSHDWNTPVSKALDIKELLPGDPMLPATLPNGDPWPTEAGALWVKAQFNLETQAGREAFSNVKFYGEDGEWSVGYTVPRGKATEEKSAESPTGKVRKIKQMNLFEFSPVLFGAASNARTFASSIKSMFANDEMREEFIKEFKSTEEEDTVEEKTEDGIENEKEIVSGPETSEEVKTTREISVKVTMTPELLEQLNVLRKEIDLVLSQVKIVSDEKKAIEIEPTDLKSAMDSLVAGTVDASVVEEIDNKVKSFEKDISDGADANATATAILDLVSDALANVSNDEEEKSLKVLASSVGLALKDSEVVAETKTEEEVVESKVTMTAEEWQTFINLGI